MEKQTGSEPTAKPSIAVIGMGCIYPGAHTPEELWVNVLAGRRFFRKAPPERMPPEYFDPDPQASGKSYCDRMAVITDWEFDPLKFRVPPVTVKASDITHWLALHTADLALKDSGLDLASLDRTRAAIMLGNSLTGEFSRSHYLRLRWPYVERSLGRLLQAQGMEEQNIRRALAAYRESFESPFPEPNEDTLAGNMSNTIAGRVCNYFDLGGGGFTVDGACSSSLLGVVLACDALVKGDLDFALAGGVDVSLDPFEIVGFAKTQALAKEDIRPYDQRAGGMLTGEGCGVLVLMRETDARARGLRIHALVKGWAYSSDGKGGITAPEVEGQARALSRAYERAGYPMSSVGYIEGHGTGTPLGDKVELTAIQKVLQSGGGEIECAIGSVKANIGHCKAAAGAAGLIKAIQALKHKILPPTVNSGRPIGAFAQSAWKLRPNLKGKAWQANGAPRRAAVSSMGFGGANSHVTLEEAAPDGQPTAENLAILGTAQASELILLAAASTGELRQQIDQLIPIAGRICHAELTDLAAALALRKPTGNFRAALVAETPWGLADSLRLVAKRLSEGTELSAIDAPADGIFTGKALQNPDFVALFPGQGSQRLNMGERLIERYPFVREALDRVDKSITGQTFRNMLGASPAQIQEWETQLKATQIAQPAIVAASTATLQVLDFLGLRPAIVIGHSLGEITALHAAGAFDADTAVHLAALRGEAMHSLHVADPGAMLAIAGRSEDVQPLLESFGKSLAISNYNSTRQTVVSGTTESIVKLRALCQAKSIRCQPLPVSHAFHSDIVAPAATAFRASLNPVQFQHLSGRVFSTSTGGEITSGTDLHELLAHQIRRPVRFVDAVKNAADRKPALWIEVGPGGVLTNFTRDILGANSVPCLPTDLAGEDSFHLLNQVLARAFVLGFPVATEKLFAHRFHRPFDVDNYHPIFIVNPCERPVELTAAMEQISSSLPSGLLPASADPDQLRDYLANRAEYLREFIALDFRHNGNTSQTKKEVKKDQIAAPKQPIKEKITIAPITQDQASLLEFATNWIAKRTGFPKSVITPDKRLRDDLNLDSIKVGELVVLMAKQAGRSPKGDPAALSNATLTKLVETIFQQESSDAVTHTATETRQVQLQSVAGLGEWVRTFRIAAAPVLITVETPQPLPVTGTVVLVGDPESPRAKAIAGSIRNQGLAMEIKDADNLGQPPADLAALIVLLPAVEMDFLRCSPAQFDARVEGFASQLFHVFRWALSANSGLRAAVVRPAGDDQDAAADFDAGAAFLKSLRLETVNSNLKWLTLPDAWPAEKQAATVIQELTCLGKVGIRYSPAGERTAEVAHSLAAEPAAPLALGPEDVALVSGGGKGITFELALELARQTGCKLALLGSSTLDAKQTELIANLERLQQAGIAHAYLQADVTDLQAVRQAVAESETQLGPITAIFHGAGVTQLRSLREKPLDEFLNCIRIKTRGLYNLLSAVPPARLKALHAISSVLGNSGMRGQTDYTFANAWLDETVRQIQTKHPHLHCLTLGYSVWADTGLGKRIGALETLRSVGVTPIGLEAGVAAYRQLLISRQPGTRFVITGRLTTDVEANLYPSAKPPPRRFLENILRWIPGTEIIADASLSHATDLYLPEHVFEGTTMFPGVMAIEAMVQAAMTCAGREDLPVLRNIVFSRPLIVPEDATVVVRTLALAEAPTAEGWCLRVAMRSSSDDFQQNHFAAECWFGLAAPGTLPACPPVPEPLDKDLADFSPTPLFQGKFFRRITAVRKLETNRASWTDVLVPEGERYFSKEHPQAVVTLSPAARDAFLQSGALVVPPGSLPESVREWRIFRTWQPGERLHIFAKCWPEGDNAFGSDIDIRNAAGELVEHIEGGLLRHSAQPARLEKTLPFAPIPVDRVLADLAERFANIPHAFATVEHASVKAGEELAEITRAEIAALRQATAPARQPSAIANLLAARRAVTQCSKTQLGVELSPLDVQLGHRADGKPKLRFTASQSTESLRGLDISLADGHGVSVAWCGPAPVGVDIELVEARDCETWHGLLGDDGYALALKIERETRESFDAAATRVWTLLEAGKKAFALRRVLPHFLGPLANSWLLFKADDPAQGCELICALVKHKSVNGPIAALAVIIGQPIQNGRVSGIEFLRELGYDGNAFKLEVTRDGPGEQLVYNQRFPITFKSIQNLSQTVPFTSYFDWVGMFRENGLHPISKQLAAVMAEGGWGLATNHVKIRVWDDLRLHDIVELRLWNEGVHPEKATFGNAFKWSVVMPDGSPRVVAQAELLSTWIQVTGHGEAKPGEVPDFLGKFLDQMKPNRYLESSSLERAEKNHERFNLGNEIAKAKPAPSPTLLHEESFQTALEDSNIVGNIYFSNYSKWLGRTRDLYFAGQFPELFRHQGAGGEFFVLSCDIDHLQEAMPYDKVLVRMFLDKLFESGADLRFEYFLLDGKSVGKKLAVAKQRVIWVNRNRSVVEALQLPNEVLNGLSGLATRHTGRKADGGARTPCGNTANSESGLLKQFGYDQDKFVIAADMSGPQNQFVFIKRFPVSFQACQTPSKKVHFTNYASWLGEVREHAILPIASELTKAFASGSWGLVTNYVNLEVLDDVEPGTTIEARFWMENCNGVRGEVRIIKCDWRKLNGNGTMSRVAFSEMGYSWVRILGHGVGRIEPLPKAFQTFIDGMAPRTEEVSPLENLPSRYNQLKLGERIWQQARPLSAEQQLFRHTISTTTENSNWVGNIYFSNYGEWMSHVRDLYFHALTPDCFRNSGRDGEWVCLSCAIDHLSEAMPFDHILVTMDVAAIYRSGIDLTFDYFLLEDNQISRKLAHGKHTMAWVGRDARNEPVALELPRNVVESLLKELNHSGKASSDGSLHERP